MISAASALVWASMAGWMVIGWLGMGCGRTRKKARSGAFEHATGVGGRGLPSYRYRPPNKYEALAAHRSCSQISKPRDATLADGRQGSLNASAGSVRRDTPIAALERRGADRIV